MYVDAHNHLDFYGENVKRAIDEINELKIITLANSMDVNSYLLNKEYSRLSQYIIPMFGVHPNNVINFNDKLEELIPYIEESKLIGEIGLDFLWVEDRSFDEKQREIYDFILRESIKREKYITIHTKAAEAEILNSLLKYNYNKAIIHWYSGPIDVLEKFVELGCYFTISVDIGYSTICEEVLNKIPMDRLLVETDGPTALEWVNGEYGYPREIESVVKKIANIKKVSERQLVDIIYDNFIRIIN